MRLLDAVYRNRLDTRNVYDDANSELVFMKQLITGYIYYVETIAILALVWGIYLVWRGKR